MRPRGSIVSQLLLVSAVFAMLIAVAAGFGYAGVSKSNSAARQISRQDYQLEDAAGDLLQSFTVSQLAVGNYVITGQRPFLRPVAHGRAVFTAGVGALMKGAPPSLRGLARVQVRAGARLFAIAAQLARLPAGSASARSAAAPLDRVGRQFYLANRTMRTNLAADETRVTLAARQSLSDGAVWSAIAIGAAVILVLAASIGILAAFSRPLRRLTACVRRQTAGDHAARAHITGAAEVRQVAEAINEQAAEADRLRLVGAESARLRGMARASGLRIREHLVAADVLDAARDTLERNMGADVVYLRLLENDRLALPTGYRPNPLYPVNIAQRQMSEQDLTLLLRLFREQASLVVQDVQGEGGNRLPRDVRRTLRRAGVQSYALVPFGAGPDLLGVIVAQRMVPGEPWSPAEIDAMESIGSDLGRGLVQARLYQAKNRMVAELKALDAARSDFFAAVSHELKAPLTTIAGYVELLEDEDDAGPITPGQRQMLDTIDRSTVRLRNLIEDVFTLSKLEAGSGGDTVSQPVPVADLLERGAEAVRPSIAAAGLAFACHGPVTDLWTVGDAGQLERALINLLSNAVKFTPAGGRIDVSATAEDDLAVITVADTGIGIPEIDQKELFTRFYRASNATTRRIPGTGLGLAIVRTVVVNHGGEVTLESQEGHGTTVTMYLPRHPAPARNGEYANDLLTFSSISVTYGCGE